MEFLCHRTKAYDSYRKIGLIMKLTTFLMLAGFLHAGAKGLSQTVTLSASRMPLDKVCTEIEKQTGFYFVYAKNMNEKKLLVTVQLKNTVLKDALRQVFEGLPFSYQVIDNVIVINTLVDPLQQEETVKPAPADTMVVKGKIVGAQYESLANATVMTVKSNIVTQTNAKGEFTLKGVTLGEEVIVSYIGYKTQRVKIAGGNIMLVMEVTDNELDKVVIQAYGTTSRRFTTSNIGVITADEIKKQPVMDPLLALTGRIAGLVINPQTGYISGPVKVEIRGRNAVNPNYASDPLYVIDGVPLTILDVGGVKLSAYSSNFVPYGYDQTHMSPAGGQSPLFNMNPNDIESIEVLKDADATAIYGSRGANGVILVNTKKGKSGKSRFDLDVSQGINIITRHWDMLNTQQYLSMRREEFKNDGITPTATAGAGYAPDLFVLDTTRYTDWQQYLWGGTGKWTNVQAGVSGGSSQAIYRIGAGYTRSTDITTISGGSQRANVALNLTTRSLDQRLTMTLVANYSFSVNNQTFQNAPSYLTPNAPPVFDSLGNLNFAAWKAAGLTFFFGGTLSPYESKTSVLNSSLTLNYTIMKGLVARANIGYNTSQTNQTSLRPIASQDQSVPPALKPTGSASFGNTQVNNWIIEPQLEYNSFLGKGALNVLVGGTAQANYTRGLIVTGNGYTDDALLKSISNALTITASENSGRYKYTGVFARIGYRLANRYIINLNGRRDGSSRFATASQFGNFGSVGAAWIISEESAVKHLLPSFVSFVKLRGSYGLTGSDAIGDYQYLSQWGNLSPQMGAYNGVSPLTSQLQPNPDFHWQVNKKLEGSLDLGFVDDRFSLSIAWYRNRCNNQLISFPTSSFTGFASVTANSPADVQNTGLELTLNAKVINHKDFSWMTDFNISANRNKLVSYPNFDQSPYWSTYKIGQSLDNRYVYNYTGIDPLTGQFTYTDYNHDGKITANESIPKGTGTDDRYVAVTQAPRFSGGLNNIFNYKNLHLSFVFTFSKQYGTTAVYGYGGTNNMSKYQYEHRWQYPGQTDALTARLTSNTVFSDQSFSSSNGYWTDASYIRLRTLAASYSLPQKWVRKAGMSGLSLTFNAQNIFVITKYKGIDPEVFNFGGIPPTRTITAGLSCSF